MVDALNQFHKALTLEFQMFRRSRPRDNPHALVAMSPADFETIVRNAKRRVQEPGT